MMSSADLKFSFENALIEEMRNYRRDICMDRYGHGYNRLPHHLQATIDDEVGKTFAEAIRRQVNAHLDL